MYQEQLKLIGRKAVICILSNQTTTSFCPAISEFACYFRFLLAECSTNAGQKYGNWPTILQKFGGYVMIWTVHLFVGNFTSNCW